jgi:hypothetical protein
MSKISLNGTDPATTMIKTIAIGYSSHRALSTKTLTTTLKLNSKMLDRQNAKVRNA